ncbi:MAG: hypothetical protein P8075_19715 [Deltaproteobacteria bacterium]|jgi:hypothetical protein
MVDSKKPADCIHYPLCQDLDTVKRDIPASFSGLHAIVLLKEARSICINCQHFEPKDLAGAA